MFICGLLYLLLVKESDYDVYFRSWYCKNMNRSQAEQLLKSEVNTITDVQRA